MKAITIKRHNDLATDIIHAIGKGRKGNDLLMADVCKQDDMARKLPGIPHNRVPEWVLPKTNKLTVKKMRPDALMVRYNNTNRKALNKATVCRPDRTANAYILEIKFCSDTNHNAKIKRQYSSMTDY